MCENPHELLKKAHEMQNGFCCIFNYLHIYVQELCFERP